MIRYNVVFVGRSARIKRAWLAIQPANTLGPKPSLAHKRKAKVKWRRLAAQIDKTPETITAKASLNS